MGGWANERGGVVVVVVVMVVVLTAAATAMAGDRRQRNNEAVSWEMHGGKEGRFRRSTDGAGRRWGEGRQIPSEHRTAGLPRRRITSGDDTVMEGKGVPSPKTRETKRGVG